MHIYELVNRTETGLTRGRDADVEDAYLCLYTYIQPYTCTPGLPFALLGYLNEFRLRIVSF